MKINLPENVSYNCESCARCCVLEEIDLYPAEAAELSERLGVPIRDFAYSGNYLWTLKEKEGGCTFLDGGGCSIHGFKPHVCAVYPLGFFIGLTNGSINVGLNPKSGACVRPSDNSIVFDKQKLMEMVERKIRFEASMSMKDKLPTERNSRKALERFRRLSLEEAVEILKMEEVSVIELG